MSLGPTEDILLAEAVDTEDAGGEIVSLTTRRLATREAGSPGEDETATDPWPPAVWEFVEKRARLIVTETPRSLRETAARIASTDHALKWIGLAAVVIALLAGLATNKLGPEKAVNVIAFPLLGLMAWNLVVYFFLFLRKLLKGGEGLSLITLVLHFVKKHMSRLAAPVSGSEATGSRILGRFAGSWAKLRMPAGASSLQAWFHVAAAVFAIGVVGGMYWHGLAREYKASWESTFITKPETTHRFFEVLFTPASIVSGLSSPSLEEVKLAGEANGPAARWIHLYAVTAALVIVVPRLFLAAGSRIRARKLRREADLKSINPAYFDGLVSAPESDGLVVLAVPHRLKLEAPQREFLRQAAVARWGGGAVVDFLPAIDYGTEDDWPEEEFENEPAAILVAMNFSSTPEEDSQGVVVDRAKQLIRDRYPDAQLAVFLDKSAFLDRMAGLEEADQRAEQRERAWERVLDKHGLRFAFLGNGSLADEQVWNHSPSAAR